MTYARTLDVEIPLESEKLADAVARALQVETDDAPPRCRIEVTHEGSTLRLRILAEETRGLRAGVNSYLRWADTAIEVARLAHR